MGRQGRRVGREQPGKELERERETTERRRQRKGRMELSGKDRYNPDLIPNLEASVDKQISGGSFDLSTNLVLLRMYQFFPDRTNSTVLVRVLVKALMQLPGTDFTQCAYLVPQRLQLKEFWEVASKCKYLWESIPGFEQSIRDFALHAINLTFSQIRKQKLGEILSLEGGELDALVKDRAAKSGWKVTGDVIRLGGNELKSKLGKSSGSNVLDFAQYGPLLGM